MNNYIRMRHLRCFAEVARQKSITRAAEALNTVQPAVSRTIRELEQEIGQPLFERTNQGVALTRSGEMLFRHVEGGLLQISEGVRQVQDSLTQNKVVFCALPNTVRTLAPRVVAAFKKTNPDVTVVVETRFYIDVLDHLRGGVVEFVVGRLLSPQHLQGLRFEQLYAEPIVFVVRRGHPLAGLPKVEIIDIDAFEVLLPMEDTILRFELDKFLIRNGVTRFSNRVETLSFEFCRTYLASNDAICCLPRGIVDRELASGELVQLNTSQDGLDGSVGITFAAGRALSEPAAELVQTFRDICRVDHGS